jgi:hypothetical protein
MGLEEVEADTLKKDGWRPCKAIIGAIKCGKCERILESDEDYWYKPHGEGDEPDTVRCVPCVGAKGLFEGMFGGLGDIFK